MRTRVWNGDCFLIREPMYWRVSGFFGGLIRALLLARK